MRTEGPRDARRAAGEGAGEGPEAEDRAFLPEFCRKPTLVLGVGNALFGDDGFGCAVVERLEADGSVPDDVCLLDTGTGVRGILFTLTLSETRPSRLLILDAIDAGRAPGELFEIDPSDIPEAKRDDFSMHHCPTSNLLRDLKEQGGMEVKVLACQTGPLPEAIAPGLSEPVRRAVAEAAARVAKGYFGTRRTEGG